MTRKSKREIERSLEDLEADDNSTIQEFFWADLKAYHDGDLTPEERVLLSNPEAHLSEQALQHVELPDRGLNSA